MTFTKIPATHAVPGHYVEITGTGATPGFALKPFRCLVIGQHGKGAGNAPNGGNPFRAFSASEVTDLAGRGSMLAHMAEAWFAANRTTEVWFVGLDDAAAAVQATSTITVTASAAAAGVLWLYIGGRQLKVSVAESDDANTIAAAIDAAVTADLDLAVTSGVFTNVVTLTARNGGAAGNDLRVFANLFEGEATPAGVTLAIVQPSGGVANPDISGVWPLIPATQYDVVSMPYTDTPNLASLKAETDLRFDPLNPLYMYGVSCAQDTVANLLALGAARNDEHVSVFGIQNSPAPTWELAAGAAAQMAAGAESHPAPPFLGRALPGRIPPQPVDQFSSTEQDGLLKDGIATFQTVSGELQIQRAVSLRQKTDGGAPTTAWRDANNHFLLAFMGWDWPRRLESNLQGCVIGDDGKQYAPGLKVLTPTGLRDMGGGILTLWGENAILEDVDAAVASLQVVRNGNEPGRLDVFVDVNLSNGLHITATQLRYTA